MRNSVLFHPFLMLIHVPVHAKSGMHLAVFLQNEVFLLSPGRVVNSAKAAWGKQTWCGLTTGPGSKFPMAGGNLAPQAWLWREQPLHCCSPGPVPQSQDLSKWPRSPGQCSVLAGEEGESRLCLEEDGDGIAKV